MNIDINELKDCQLLTIDEFAEKMSVKPPTIREWIKDGILVQQRHFLKVNSVTRFPWPYVLKFLLAKDVAEAKRPPRPHEHKTTSKVSSRREPINWDY